MVIASIRNLQPGTTGRGLSDHHGQWCEGISYMVMREVGLRDYVADMGAFGVSSDSRIMSNPILSSCRFYEVSAD